MRNLRLLSTAAAVVLIGTAAASAQELKKDEAPAPAPAAQQSAPAEKVAPAMKPGEHKADVQKKLPETTGQAPKASDADKPRAGDKDAMDKDPARASSGANSGGNVKSKAHEGAAEGAAGSKASQSTTEKNGSTTGQGSAAGSAKLSTEQRSKITTIIKQQKVEPAHLTVSVRVGTRVPDSVRFYPLPAEVIVIYPEWRGYDYILVGDEIIVINPRTHEIVAIIEA
jgi:Protein of unknown function (DUF1236)